MTRRRTRAIRRYAGAADVRGYGGLSQLPLLPIALGLGALAFFILGRTDTVSTIASGIASAAKQLLGNAFDFAKAQAFKLALPSYISPYATNILVAAQRYGIDPWVLAGIMYRESRGGDALTPKGPTGTGDFIPRKPGNRYYQYANPNTGLPPDGKGWGRGLMQIDYGVHNAWVSSAQWWDPQTNINKAAEIFKEHLDYFRRSPGGPITIEAWRVNTGMPQNSIQPWKSKFPGKVFPTSAPDPRPLSGQQLYEAALAAYNAGPSGVLQAIAVGLPAEAVTSGQDYVSYFLTRIASWQANFR